MPLVFAVHPSVVSHLTCLVRCGVRYPGCHHPITVRSTSKRTCSLLLLTLSLVTHTYSLSPSGGQISRCSAYSLALSPFSVTSSYISMWRRSDSLDGFAYCFCTSFRIIHYTRAFLYEYMYMYPIDIWISILTWEHRRQEKCQEDRTTNNERGRNESDIGAKGLRRTHHE